MGMVGVEWWESATAAAAGVGVPGLLDADAGNSQLPLLLPRHCCPPLKGAAGLAWSTAAADKALDSPWPAAEDQRLPSEALPLQLGCWCVQASRLCSTICAAAGWLGPC